MLILLFTVTERARQLRAHYALQSSDLRSRIERRVNRIPTSLRKANMGELFQKYPEATANPPSCHKTDIKPHGSRPMTNLNNGHPLPPVPKSPSKPPSPARPATTASNSTIHADQDAHLTSDKENDTKRSLNLDNPKNPKRVQPTSNRVAPRMAKQNSVLSPKSHNSRTLPRSPIKDLRPQSPTKYQSYIARPASPLKPPSPLKSAASAATSAISASLHGMVEHAKRGAGVTAQGLTRTNSKEKSTVTAPKPKPKKTMAPPPRPVPQPQEGMRTISQASQHSNSSNASGSSTGTTVVKKGGRPATKTTNPGGPGAKKTTAASVAKAALRNVAKSATTGAGKKVVVAEPAAGRRVLRSRN